MAEMEKHYDPHAVEAKWYQAWLDARLFRGELESGRAPYCIVIPPPNVTGILHMGHALNNTIQDILIRSARMRGKDACWVPGTDHASIATESKVVQMLAAEGIAKDSLTRDQFLEHAWAWKEKYGGIIINQLKRMGCACDWERERFTMDPKFSRSVLEAFVRLYDKGLIYRGYRLVNWCPASRSAISDEEVQHREVNGKLWYFRYPVVGSEEHVIVATTRPETMLGDTAVAVNPDDPRYRRLVGRTIRLPLVGREIPVIADAFVDPQFGTGCVKVTPAHDPNDFAMGERHRLEFINIMNDDASLNDKVPAPYRGLSREAARSKVVADLDAAGLVDRVEPHRNKVGYSQRGGVPIESYMSEQWFMSMKELAEPALQAVLSGRIRVYPEHWVKTYQHWMEGIRDWCISRQLWWGHRIPVWYRKGADRNDPASRHVSVNGPRDPENWEQDEDVLDTWASSWLWPMAVHDWPEATAELKAYYPGAVLVTAPDIIFFWVARMIMAGCEFMREIPFRDVYIHGIVRDDAGQKMSKSLGNSIDPLSIIQEYSADALRFSLIMLTATGQDTMVSQEKFEIGRNFATKIWNAARFMQMQTRDFTPCADAPDLQAALLRPDDIHLLARLDETIVACEDLLARYRLNDYAHALYDFVWHNYCDWYVESCKAILYGEDGPLRTSVLTIMHYAFSNALRLLHPVMPFLTEELAHSMGYLRDGEFLLRCRTPEPFGEATRERWGMAPEVVAYVSAKHELIRAGRTLMADYGLLPSAKIHFTVRPTDVAAQSRLAADLDSVKGLLRVGSVELDVRYAPAKAMPGTWTPLGQIYMPVEGLIDIEAERQRLGKLLAKVEKDIEGTIRKLGNADFAAKAPRDVVAQQEERLVDLREKREKLQRLLDALT